MIIPRIFSSKITLRSWKNQIPGLGALVEESECTGSGTNDAPLYYKIFSYKIISMPFCNTTLSHSSTPCDVLGEMFKFKL